jgi:hypothetical protein
VDSYPLRLYLAGRKVQAAESKKTQCKLGPERAGVLFSKGKRNGGGIDHLREQQKRFFS